MIQKGLADKQKRPDKVMRRKVDVSRVFKESGLAQSKKKVSKPSDVATKVDSKRVCGIGGVCLEMDDSYEIHVVSSSSKDSRFSLIYFYQTDRTSVPPDLGFSPTVSTHSTVADFHNTLVPRAFALSPYAPDARAYLVKRPLVDSISIGGHKYTVPIGIDYNLVTHWALKLPDGKYIGYYGDNRVREDDKINIPLYQDLTLGNNAITFNANVLAQALGEVLPVWDGSKYHRCLHNCHDFIDAVVAKYIHLGGVVKQEVPYFYIRFDY